MAIIILAQNKKLSYKWLRFAQTGIEILDAQHQELLDHMNQIKEMLEQGVEPEMLGKKLAALRGWFGQHFEYEDQRMLARGYAGFSAHFDAHQAFMEGPLLKTVTDPQGQEGYDINALIDWEANHISRMDRPMAEYLLSRA
ncbi:MAG: hemerythrin domain-containing protein [Magnetococcales bacterium]|nr:hemerythrin domain-containing protein [Magnetococcales bacterium]